MLLRLADSLGWDDLIEEMVLLPGPASVPARAETVALTNLVVGFNGSPKSQTALDLALGIAHQTRLATRKQVTVQVVYVVDQGGCPNDFRRAKEDTIPFRPLPLDPQEPLRSSSLVLTQQESALLAVSKSIASADPGHFSTIFCPDPLEQADRILWQARCLAEEWRGSLKAHLRFGSVAIELRKVVEAEGAVLLFLGCQSADHPVVQKLGSAFPCSVLGIPSLTSSESHTPEAVMDFPTAG